MCEKKNNKKKQSDENNLTLNIVDIAPDNQNKSSNENILEYKQFDVLRGCKNCIEIIIISRNYHYKQIQMLVFRQITNKI